MFATQVGTNPGTTPGARNFTQDFISRAASTGAAAVERLRHASCGLMGHSMTLRLETTRVSLECMHCRLNTPGWIIGRAS